MKIFFLGCIILLTTCSMLTACGQAGRLYLPSQQTSMQTQYDVSKT